MSTKTEDKRNDDLAQPHHRTGVNIVQADREERQRLLDEKPFDYIERTKPEDRLGGRFGQLTRDNVNPNIPSAKPGTGGVVQPESTSGGVAPPPAPAPTPQEGLTPEQAAALQDRRPPSINEPPGSDIVAGDAGPIELPPLVLSDIDPDSVAIGMTDFTLTVTGSGFTPATVIVFDDEEMPTVFLSPTRLTANPPSPAEPAIVDVEVHRGEDMSDVLAFEFTAAARAGEKRERQAPERKPKKAEPVAKRTKKGKR